MKPSIRKKINLLAIILLIICLFLLLLPNILKKGSDDLSTVEIPKIYEDYYEGLTRDKCESMENKEERSLCQSKILFAQALHEGNYEICDIIENNEDLKKECYLELAVRRKDDNICNEFSDEDFRNNCFKRIAVAARNENLCFKLNESQHEIKECRDRVKSFVVSNSKKVSECYDIETLEYARLCLGNIFKNTFDCIEIDEKYKDDCLDYRIFSTNELTEELCEKIKDIHYKEYCYLIVLYGHEGASKIDSDEDGLNDGNEIFMRLDPHNPDTDNDGLLDRPEVFEFHTDPNNPDTDGDGYQDGEEVAGGYNPSGEGKLKQ